MQAVFVWTLMLIIMTITMIMLAMMLKKMTYRYQRQCGMCVMQACVV